MADIRQPTNAELQAALVLLTWLVEHHVSELRDAVEVEERSAGYGNGRPLQDALDVFGVRT